MTKREKLEAGVHLILRDYAEGLFPPTFDDQQKAYSAEIAYRFSLAGITPEHYTSVELRKPFWVPPVARRYFGGFCRLLSALERAGVAPPAKILELGCGSGWMAEFLAAMQFKITATTLSEHDVADVLKRAESLRAKGIDFTLRPRVAPMETAADIVREDGPFDAVFVFEALHHAFDWRKTLASAHACLADGGWFLICNEPNLVHTFSSYRMAKLSNTHEIGLSRRALTAQLRSVGFKNILSVGRRPHLLLFPHWLLARK